MNNRSAIDNREPETESKVFAAIELSSTAWVVALHLPTKDKISIVRVGAGDVARLVDILERARNSVRSTLGTGVQICTCYEAGYDGFWLHRLLITKGIHNQILNSASIQVSRRRRNAKTDRIDAEGLVRVLMALHRGEARVCSVVNVPTCEEEDVKRLHRSRQKLIHERVRHVNRIKGLSKLQGINHIEPNREGWMSSLLESANVRWPAVPSLLDAGDTSRSEAACYGQRPSARGLHADRYFGAICSAPEATRCRSNSTPGCDPTYADPRHRSNLRIGVCNRSVLSQVCQSPCRGKLCRPYTHSLQQRQQQSRSRDQQSRQRLCSALCHRTGVAVVAQSAIHFIDDVV